MAKLYLHDQKITNIFQLLGENENDITYSLGWALSQSRSFLKQFLELALNFKEKIDQDEVKIRLQKYEEKYGITDIEIELGEKLFVIIEAKRGWNLPTKKQLRQYTERIDFRDSKARLKRLIVLTECNKEFCETNLNISSINNIKVINLSWRDVYLCSREAIAKGRHAEKRLLFELEDYFERIMTMQKLDSNWVYVVSLSYRIPRRWKISFVDIVNKKALYFHILGKNGWPSEPPNYIAFRYNGELQSIHHIESYEVFTNPHKVVKEIPNGDWGSFYLYHLGPRVIPNRKIKTGKIYANGRVWCMLDTLFTNKTIAAARDESKKRDNSQF